MTERDRLGPNSLERLRTEELLTRFLPAPPSRVLDVGGGAGVYSAWLAEQGHDVHLVDAIELHVDQAREAAGDPPSFTAEVGDARSLAEPDSSRDVVLLLGPLYHLTERADRVAAIAEARRVVRPGGVLVAAAISRVASLLSGLTDRHLHHAEFRRIVEEDLRTGQHRNPTGDPRWFTTAFFHAPDELEAEILEAGFGSCRVLGVEGPGCVLEDLPTRMADPRERDVVLHAARLSEEDPLLLATSHHLLAVAEA